MESLGFHVIPVKWDKETESGHTLMYKKHIMKTGVSKTLFVTNVPCYCTEVGLSNIFSECGTIESIKLLDEPGQFDVEEKKSLILDYTKPKSSKFKVAYITFKEKSSVQIALELSPAVTRYINTEENPILTGVEKWIADYKSRYVDEQALQEEADRYLREFDKKEWQDKQDMKNGEEPDGEGWVTIPVKKNNLKKPAKTKKQISKEEKKKRKENELKNFYLFQQREVKRDKVAELRKKFEEDKKRIAQMRQQRKFKPF